MKCLEEQTLHRFLRGDLEVAERAAIEAHVDVCPACRRAVAAVVAETASGELGAAASGEALATTGLSPASCGCSQQVGGLELGEQVDHFRVEGPLGAGGMGEVYLAEDTQLRRKVALKLIRPRLLGDDENAARLLREAQTTARFNHPNIVTIHHVGTHDGAPYLALEYLDGETLRRRVERDALGGEELVEVLLAVAGALQEAHRHGVLHRDLKPENVMLPTDGRPRVLDFGLSAAQAQRPLADAPLADLPAHQSISTHHHSLRGTPAYMAPEQWRGEACTEATDIWALGVLLHELITGARPFVEGDLLSLRTRVLDALPAPALPQSAAPEALRELCTRCLDKRPEGRPSAAQVLEALAQQRVAATAAAAPGGGVLAYLFVLVGALFTLGGLAVVMGTISNWVDGTSDDPLYSDVLIGVIFGLAPAALGLAGVHLGLKRRPHRAFLITLGALVGLIGTVMGLAALGEILEGDPKGDPLGFNLVFLVFLGLVPVGLGVLMLVGGIAARRRQGVGAAASSGGRASARAAAAPTAPQRRA